MEKFEIIKILNSYLASAEEEESWCEDERNGASIEDIDENAGARGSGFTDPERIMRDSAFCALEAIQPADVRPVVRGKWEIDNSYAGPGLMNLRCSVCGEFGGTWRDCTLPSMLYKFCPNCGADMRPDKNDQRGENYA